MYWCRGESAADKNMAKFYKSQQKFLRKFLEANPNEQFFDINDLPTEVWERLVEMRDTETLWTDVNSFLYDFICERR